MESKNCGFKVFAIVHALVPQAAFLKIIFQDKSGEIENEELSGFLKDLLELVKNVSCVNIK